MSSFSCREFKVFLDQNAHKLLAYTFDDGERPELKVAVVKCKPITRDSSYPTVSQLALELGSQGWNAMTKERLCDSPVFGIMLLVGWPEDAMLTLSNTAYNCGVGCVEGICVFDGETRELAGSVFYPEGGGIMYGETEQCFVIAFEGGTYYRDPDDKMNTSTALPLARRFSYSEYSQAQDRAAREGGTLELWKFQGDNPIKRINFSMGAALKGKYGNKTALSGIKPLDLMGGYSTK